MSPSPHPLKALVGAPLIDLGNTNPDYAGIFAFTESAGSKASGVTAQFTEEAGAYHSKYFDTAHSEWMLGTALKRIPPLGPAPVILDVGSGSGNSVIAALKLIPDCTIIATDASPQLLAILTRALTERGEKDRVLTLCVDLNQASLAPGMIDLIIGSAILHHLFEPDVLIKRVFPSVKPGGSAVFFEPFEIGYYFVSLLYQYLTLEAATRAVDPLILRFFSAKVEEIANRRCEPKPYADYQHVDDKWLFTRPYLANLAATIGATLDIYPLVDVDTPLSSKVRTDLRLGLGLEPDALPEWAWRTIKNFEQSPSRHCREEMIVEGGVIFRQSVSTSSEIPGLWNPDKQDLAVWKERSDHQPALLE